ncbi:MAG: lipopolysaccharide biosynthesis protein, partial [Arenimonas sp.]
MPTSAWPAAVFVLAAAGCGLLTLAWIRFARLKQIQDHPGQRRLHELPTPRGGGIAIAITVIVALFWLTSIYPQASSSTGLAFGLAAFAALGLLDDVAPVSAPVKFVLQLLAATALIAGVSQGWGLGWFAMAGLIVACCYVVNIWNFMDGSNGMVAVQALLIALAMAFWPGQPWDLRLFALALAGACAGFLPFNLPKARVFLGDVGSHVLGAAVFGLMLLAWRSGTIDVFQALLLGTVLLLDSGYTLLRRLLGGRKFWRAHRDHLYQYAVRRGHSHVRVCLSYAAGTVISIALALSANDSRSSIVLAGLLILNWLLG